MLALAAAVGAGALTTFLLVPQALAFLRSSGIVGIDQQKQDRPQIPTSGGITVLFGFMVAVRVYIGLQTFLLGGTVPPDALLAALSSVLIVGLIGLIDDIHVDQSGVEEKGAEQVRVGLAQRYKYVAPLLAAFTLMVVQAGVSSMAVPLAGVVELGALYPLVLVPVAVTCVVNATNMLAGQNGLEAGMGAVALAGIGVFAALQGRKAGAVVALGMAGPLLAFLRYNRYPARILPGDSLTYTVGAAIVAAVILANVELFGLVVFLPWIFEAFFKLRSRFQASSLGVLQDDGTLKPQHDAVYSLTHVLMRYDLTEPQIVRTAVAAELILVLAALTVFV